MQLNTMHLKYATISTKKELFENLEENGLEHGNPIAGYLYLSIPYYC